MIRKQAVAEIKVTFVDGTHETFYPPTPEAAYYIERLTYADSQDGVPNKILLDCHEIFWVIRHEGKSASDLLRERNNAKSTPGR